MEKFKIFCSLSNWITNKLTQQRMFILFSYIIAAIDMVREVMKRWWKELQTIGRNEKKDIGNDFRCSRYGTVYTVDSPIWMEYAYLFNKCTSLVRTLL